MYNLFFFTLLYKWLHGLHHSSLIPCLPLHVEYMYVYVYYLPHLEYCCPLLLGIFKPLKNNMEHTNQSLCDQGITESKQFGCEYGCYTWAKTSLAIGYTFFFKCFKSDGPNYLSQFFTPRLTRYNLQGIGVNAVQPPYTGNSHVMYNSYLYIIVHIWNRLPHQCRQILEHFSTISCSPE